ncbi:MAG: alpha/beta hydrolase [Polyangiaceae bacterium]|jgi:epsilon-lactone hydrolase
MREQIVGPRLPGLRTLVLDVALRVRMKRRNRSHVVTAEGLRIGARRFRESMARIKQPPFVAIDATTSGGRPAEWVHLRSEGGGASPVKGASKRVVLYFHGGGFFMSSPVEHRGLTWRMARACSARVLAVDYRKAPDHAFPAWLDDALAAYKELLASGHEASDIIVSGDSAGGNIALALTHRLRREGLPMPGKLVLFSPWADLACQGQSFHSNARRDAMFNPGAVRALGSFLTHGRDAFDPEVSPAYADFRGFPDMLVFAGSTEVFLDDARTVARRAREAGVRAELYVYRHMPHVFPMFAAVIPSAKGAFTTVKRFVEA